MQIYRWVAALLLCRGAYFHYKNFRSTALDLADHYTLTTSHSMLLAALVGGCFMQLLYQVSFGVQVALILLTLSFSRMQPDKYELKYFLIGIGFSVLWMLLRVWTTKTWEYAAGTEVQGIHYEGVVPSLECWNCTYREFVLYPTACLVTHLVGVLEAQKIIKNDRDTDHSWKIMVIKYKVSVDLLCLCVQIIFNAAAELQVQSLPECSLFWIGSTLQAKVLIAIVKTLVFVVPSMATYAFYSHALPLYRRQNIETAVLQEEAPATAEPLQYGP